MIRILHLSYSDRNSGAGIAAQRIHKCICDYDISEVKSLLRINTKNRDNLRNYERQRYETIY